jgi:hypothetical protein
MPAKKRHDGICEECGRKDVVRTRVGLAFHYSPDPCGTPCAGGRLSFKAEDRALGVHRRGACRNCKAA